MMAATGAAGNFLRQGLQATRTVFLRIVDCALNFLHACGQYTIGCGCSRVAAGYNLRVRIAATLLLILSLAGCHRGVENNDAVRQGVLDYLKTKNMTPDSMDITVKSVKYNGDAADAVVSFAAKGTGAGQMQIQYHLEQKDGKWKVVGRQDANQHGGGAIPGGAPQGGAPAGSEPHGGGAMAPGSGGKMPAPEDLPPAGQKK